MNTKVYKTLEFDKILNMLSSFAATPAAKKACLSLEPFTDEKEIYAAQQETDDAIKRLVFNNHISFGGVKDIGETVKRLEKGSALSSSELLLISTTLDAALNIKSYGKNYAETRENKDFLQEMFDRIEPLSVLNKEIKRVIISEDEIADDASSDLKNIRRRIKAAMDKIRNQMNSMLASATMRTYLQDFVITMRDGRYCLPVKAEYKSSVGGIVHDQSSSGSTLFIEPTASVELNNELRELEVIEKAEIEKILAELSAQVSAYSNELKTDFLVLSELDFIFAKAMFSLSIKGSRPTFNKDRIIDIKRGRHPLLKTAKVVPIDIRVGKEYDQLIITGPNTGGKTVALKTVGLFTLMGQAGLFIPADDGSVLGIFKDVFADIGDEQSIEQNLSTFSSHMKNIINILGSVGYDSLVLTDELCAGTDPVEGAALAIAILTYLHNMTIRTIATTHYSEIKMYALNDPGIENASMEFDVETLSPTYRILIGVPGKSNAFAISEKLGLPKYITEEAKKLVDADKASFEDIVTDLEINRVSLERERSETQSLRAKLQQTKDQYDQRVRALEEKKEEILRKAHEEATDILQEAKDYADLTIRNINKYGVSTKELEAERTNLREALGKHKKEDNKPVEKRKTSNKPHEFKPGDEVFVHSLGLDGVVSSKPNAKGNVFVQMGILRSEVNVADLDLIKTTEEKDKEVKKTSVSHIKAEKSLNISPEINLIGMNVDEAVAELDKYLDDAYLANLPKVRIIHGRGTGALRNGIWQHIKRLPYVKSYHLAEYNEGGDGATIVEFKS